MKAIILIGGFGTRLRPFTLHTPKPLLPVLNRPFLEIQLKQLHSYGIRDVILCTAYRPQAFRKCFGDGRRLGLKLRYVHETIPQGTGGAIKNAHRWIDGTTLICNGDILMDLNIHRFLENHRSRRAAVSLALTRVTDPTAYGLISTNSEGVVTQFLEKPSPDQVTTDTINAGFYLFEPNVFNEIPEKKVTSVERDTFPFLLQEGYRLCAEVFDGYWLDMGTVAKYQQANLDVLEGRFPFKHSEKKTSWGWMNTGTKIHKTARIQHPVIFGKNVRVQSGAQVIGPSVIGDDVVIGENAVIEKSILLSGVHIETRAEIRGSVTGFHSHIGENAILSPGTALAPQSKIGAFSKL